MLALEQHRGAKLMDSFYNPYRRFVSSVYTEPTLFPHGLHSSAAAHMHCNQSSASCTDPWRTIFIDTSSTPDYTRAHACYSTYVRLPEVIRSLPMMFVHTLAFSRG